jgi:starvation-inducible DNA-binding protein
MYQTQNDLAQITRQNVIEALQKYLASGIDLVLQAKQAHWNVRGPHFISLHELFDKVHEESENYQDLIAERIAQLGGTAEGTSQAVTKNSALPQYSLTMTDEADHIKSLCASIAMFTKQVREGIEKCDQWHDAVTCDILTEIARSADKNLWMVESHLIGQQPAAKNVKGVA